MVPPGSLHPPLCRGVGSLSICDQLQADDTEKCLIFKLTMQARPPVPHSSGEICGQWRKPNASCKYVDCAAKSKQNKNKSRNGFAVRQTPALAAPAGLCLWGLGLWSSLWAARVFPRLALVSWCLSRTHAPVKWDLLSLSCLFFCICI